MFDLLIKGAHVVDPLNHVNGKADVAVKDGKIAAVGRDLTGDAKEIVDFWAVCGAVPTARGCSQ